MVPAGDDPGDKLRLDAERRGHFARIENAETAARARTDVEQAMSARECGDDQIDSALYLRDRGAAGGGDRRVLVVYEVKYLPRRHRGRVSGAGVAGIGVA